MLNIVILITSIVLSTSAQNIAIEKLLKRSLLNTDYDRTIRPADTVEIYLQFLFKQIVSLDDKNQIITSSSTLLVYTFNMEQCFSLPTGINHGQSKSIVVT